MTGRGKKLRTAVAARPPRGLKVCRERRAERAADHSGGQEGSPSGTREPGCAGTAPGLKAEDGTASCGWRQGIKLR